MEGSQEAVRNVLALTRSDPKDLWASYPPSEYKRQAQSSESESSSRPTTPRADRKGSSRRRSRSFDSDSENALFSFDSSWDDSLAVAPSPREHRGLSSLSACASKCFVRPKRFLCGARFERCWTRACVRRSCLLVGVPLLVASVAFVVAFCIVAVPDLVLEAHVEPAVCTVLNHTVLDIGPSHDNVHLLYLPALAVCFDIDHDNDDGDGDDDGGNGSGEHQRVRADALASLSRQRAWMGAAVMERFFLLHPINGTISCYYDAREPARTVASRPSTDSLHAHLLVCALVTVAGFVGGLFVGFLCLPWHNQ